MSKLERKYVQHFLCVPGLAKQHWYRIGKDLEELNIALEYNTETKKNVWGEISMLYNGVTANMEVDPFYYDKDNELGEYLKGIAFNRNKENKTCIMDIIIDPDETSGGYFNAMCTVRGCEIIPKNIGGGLQGVNFSYQVQYNDEDTLVETLPKATNILFKNYLAKIDMKQNPSSADVNKLYLETGLTSTTFEAFRDGGNLYKMNTTTHDWELVGSTETYDATKSYAVLIQYGINTATTNDYVMYSK